MRRLFILLFILLSLTYSRTAYVVTNGEPTAHSEVPSIVALVRPDGSMFCSGTLIAKDLVLTAAHCVHSKSPADLRVAYKTFNPENTDNNCFYNVSDIAVYPDYGMNSLDGGPWDDVAILRLSEDVFDANPSPILPTMYYDSLLAKGSMVLIAGYGRTEPVGGDKGLHSGMAMVMQLKQFEIIVGEPDDDEVNACKGDSGGPIYVTLNNIRYVTGIASRLTGGSPAACGHGVLYTLPGLYVDWIYSAYAHMSKVGDIRPSACKYILPDLPTIGCSRCSIGIYTNNLGLIGVLLILLMLVLRRQ